MKGQLEFVERPRDQEQVGNGVCSVLLLGLPPYRHRPGLAMYVAA